MTSSSSSSPLPSLTFRILSSFPSGALSPRLGLLELFRPLSGEKISLPTPGFFLHTPRGVVPHLSRDHVQRLDTYMPWVHVPFEPFLETSPPTPTLQPEPYPLHSFLGMPSSKHILSLSLRDPADARERPSNGEKYVSAMSVRGVRKIDAASYSAYASAVQPDVIVALSDVPFTPPPYSQKRLTKSIERTSCWLTDLLRRQLWDLGIQPFPPWNILVTMVGGGSIAARRNFAESLLEPLERGHPLSGPHEPPLVRLDDAVAGYIVELLPLKLGGSKVDLALPRPIVSSDVVDGAASVVSLVQASLSLLPIDKPRLAHTAASPHEILQLITFAGVDFFDSHWAQKAADWGIALDFSFPVQKSGQRAPGCRPDGRRDVGHNLFDMKYALDFGSFAETNQAIPFEGGSLVTGRCPCLACSPLFTSPIAHGALGSVPPRSTDVATPHTRAYIHHLLHTHEMSSHALLVSHNLVVLDNFFRGVRMVLEQSSASFEREVERFEEEYDGQMCIMDEAKQDWESVDLARGKGRLAREKKGKDDSVPVDIGSAGVTVHVADELLGG